MLHQKFQLEDNVINFGPIDYKSISPKEFFTVTFALFYLRHRKNMNTIDFC